MTAEARAARQVLGQISWADIGRFGEALTFARKELFGPVHGIRKQYGLGPRGIWIVGLIATGRVHFQSDITKLWKIGRSMVAEEMACLAKAALVTARPSEEDRRQVRLELTDKGRSVNEEVGNAFAGTINSRLASYSPEDLEFCIRLLNNLAGPGQKPEFTSR